MVVADAIRRDAKKRPSAAAEEPPTRSTVVGFNLFLYSTVSNINNSNLRAHTAYLISRDNIVSLSHRFTIRAGISRRCANLCVFNTKSSSTQEWCTSVIPHDHLKLHVHYLCEVISSRQLLPGSKCQSFMSSSVHNQHVDTICVSAARSYIHPWTCEVNWPRVQRLDLPSVFETTQKPINGLIILLQAKTIYIFLRREAR